MVNAVFAMQGVGQLAAAIILLIVTVGFKDGLASSPKPAACSTSYACASAVDKMWRIVVGFGAVPACLALYCEFVPLRVVGREGARAVLTPTSQSA